MGLEVTTAAADQPDVELLWDRCIPRSGDDKQQANKLNVYRRIICTHLHSVNNEDMTRLQLNCNVSCGDKSQLLGAMLSPYDTYQQSGKG